MPNLVLIYYSTKVPGIVKEEALIHPGTLWFLLIKQDRLTNAIILQFSCMRGKFTMLPCWPFTWSAVIKLTPCVIEISHPPLFYSILVAVCPSTRGKEGRKGKESFTPSPPSASDLGSRIGSDQRIHRRDGGWILSYFIPDRRRRRRRRHYIWRLLLLPLLPSSSSRRSNRSFVRQSREIRLSVPNGNGPESHRITV